MKEKFDVTNYHETRIALLENSVAHISDTLKDIKQDIHSLRVELKTDICELRTELKSDILSLRSELKQDITALRIELKKDISNLDIKIESNIKDIRSDIKQVTINANSQFKWLMGTMISFHFSLLVAVVIKVFNLI